MFLVFVDLFACLLVCLLFVCFEGDWFCFVSLGFSLLFQIGVVV